MDWVEKKPKLFAKPSKFTLAFGSAVFPPIIAA
jgi:hypothetical protein